jgi:RNA polymerase sigma-70 factor (ECF subfamily)
MNPSEREREVEREVADLRPMLTGVLPDGWDRRPLTSADRIALDAALREVWLVVYYRARLRVRDQAAAEDVAQEAFCRVLNRLATRDDGTAIEPAYVTRTARNLLHDQWRTAEQRRAGDTTVARDPSGTVADPEADVLQQIEGEEVRVALTALPSAQRQVIRLRIFEQLTAEQTAAVLGRNAEWVRQTQHRALRALRERMTRSDADKGGGP